MIQKNSRLPRTSIISQLANEVHSLQLVVQEISDLLADREQVIDTLSQEIQHLYERIEDLEKEQISLHQGIQHHSFGSISHSRSSLSSLQGHAIDKVEREAPALSKEFVEELTRGLERALTQSFDKMLSKQQQVVHHVVPAVATQQAVPLSKEVLSVTEDKEKQETALQQEHKSLVEEKKEAVSQGHKKIVKQNHLHARVKKEHAFKLASGEVVHSVGELVETIKQNDESWFYAHVADGKNDFSCWVRDVFENPSLAEQIESLVTREEFLAFFDKSKE